MTNNGKKAQYPGSLFNPTKSKKRKISYIPNQDNDKLIEIQASILVKEYGCSAFSADQVQKITGLGETSVYELLKKLPVGNIGKRKVISAVVLAAWMIKGLAEKEA